MRKKDKNDNPFWDISVMDGTGQIDGKIWGSSEWWNLEGDSRIRLDPLADDAALGLEGCTVGLMGKVVEFRDQNQYNFNVVYRVDQEKYPPHGFVRRSPFSDEAMEAGIMRPGISRSRRTRPSTTTSSNRVCKLYGIYFPCPEKS